MRICSPHCGVDPETTSGGETYEREVLRHLGVRGDLRHFQTMQEVPIFSTVARTFNNERLSFWRASIGLAIR